MIPNFLLKQSRAFKSHAKSLRRKATRRLFRIERLEDRLLLDGGGILPDRFEPNELFESVSQIGVAPGVHLSELSIHEAGDTDWYSFRVLRNDSVDVKIDYDTNQATLVLEVFDASGLLLADGVVSSEGLIATLNDLSPGHYFASVIGVGGSTSYYDLSITPASTSQTTVFYVNDSDLANSYYTLAAGNNVNAGLSPFEPKASVQSVLADYMLGPTDLVVIDTGTYFGAITIDSDDEGAAYAGSPGGSILTGSGTRFDLMDADFNLIYGLVFEGTGGTGIQIRPSSLDSSTDNIIRDNTFYGFSTAILVDGGTGNVVVGNQITGTGNYGVDIRSTAVSVTDNLISHKNRAITASGSVHASISFNTLVDNYYGIRSSSPLTVSGNALTGNEYGLYSEWGSWDTVAYGNLVSGNAIGLEGYGIFGGNSWNTDQSNVISGNGIGIQPYSGATVRFNRIENNTTGVQVSAGQSHTLQVHNNIFDRNVQFGLSIEQGNQIAVVNNTLYQESGVGIRLANSTQNVELKNNIIWSEGVQGLFVAPNSQQGFSSDYNNLYSTGGSILVHWQQPFHDLFDWQVESGFDQNSIGYTALDPGRDNPLFVDLAGSDFRLTPGLSTSIAAGDPTSLFHNEPGAGGGRINLGAYGNTALAAEATINFLRIQYPEYYADWPAETGRAILWHGYDFTQPNEQLAGNVRLELHEEGVGWIADIATVAASEGSYGWSPEASGVAPSLDRRFRIVITSLLNPSIQATSREAFSVPPDTVNYYINDASDVGDVFTASGVVGDNRNTGTTPDDPKANLIPLLRAYPLGPGDTVHVDTGHYVQVRNPLIQR